LESCKLFAWVGLEPPSSPAQPPKELGSQAWGTGSRLDGSILIFRLLSPRDWSLFLSKVLGQELVSLLLPSPKSPTEDFSRWETHLYLFRSDGFQALAVAKALEKANVWMLEWGRI
jgi:hypothetical protein